MKSLDDYRRLLLESVPLMDVRAPVEFDKGAFPNATNIPLLEDNEREQVGIRYKQQGNEKAVELGHELVSGQTRDQRMERWIEFTRQHPEGALYCFRGGQRSAIVQAWLAEAGIDYPRVQGGYKAMRGFLLGELERLAATQDLLLLGGRTGVGKTELLLRLDGQLDLEGLANHRGSGFGRRVSPQPAQIDFENRLVIEWLRHEAAGHTRVLLEDESRCIGRITIPESLWARFEEAPVVLLEDSLESRVLRTRAEYCELQRREFEAAFGDEGFQHYAEHLLASLDRIRRRLGGARHAELRDSMTAALELQRTSGNLSGHDHWIRCLLKDYYDPMYDYQIASKQDRVRYAGAMDEVLEYLNQQIGKTPLGNPGKV